MTVSTCVPSAAAPGHVLGPRGIDVGQQQPRAGLRIGQGNGLADAAAGACHDGAAAVQWLGCAHVGCPQLGQRTVTPPSAMMDWPVM